MSRIIKYGFVTLVLTDEVLFEYQKIHNVSLETMATDLCSNALHPSSDQLLILGTTEDEAYRSILRLSELALDDHQVHCWMLEPALKKDLVNKTLVTYLAVFQLKSLLTSSIKDTGAVTHCLDNLFSSFALSVDVRDIKGAHFDWQAYSIEKISIEEKRFVLDLFGKYQELLIVPDIEMSPLANHFVIRYENGSTKLELAGRYEKVLKSVATKIDYELFGLNSSPVFSKQFFENLSKLMGDVKNAAYTNLNSHVVEFGVYRSVLQKLDLLDDMRSTLLEQYNHIGQQLYNTRHYAEPFAELHINKPFLATLGDQGFALVSDTEQAKFDIYFDNKKLEIDLALDDNEPDEDGLFYFTFNYAFPEDISVTFEPILRGSDHFDVFVSSSEDM